MKLETKKRSRSLQIGDDQRLRMESTLVDLVLDRPALYNYKLPISQQSPAIKNKLWGEILQILDPEYGPLSDKVVRAIWTRLRDNYRRYYSIIKRAQSGSETVDIEKPKFFERLQTLDSVFAERV